MIRSYKFRLFPNANQRRELERTLETHRRLYNRVLDGKMLCWETEGINWRFFEQSRWFTIQRHKDKHLAALNITSARQTLRKLDKAYATFFSRPKSKRAAGHPRFKGRDRFHSFSFLASNGCKIIDRKLRLQHIGTMRVRWHRNLPTNGELKSITIKRTGDKWFASFAVEIPDPLPATNNSHVGIDVGLKSFVTTSDGEELGDSRSLERALPELRRRQRALARCKRGSNRRKLVKRRVVALYAKVFEVRRDIHHKVARSLVDRYGVIAAEGLSVSNMLKNRRLARRISDAGWGQFIGILANKAEGAGSKFVLVDPKNTSQECSSCGAIVRKSLAVRVHECACGCVLDRDVNAAKNVLGRAGPSAVKDGWPTLA